MELNATVVRAALLRLVVVDRLLLTEAVCDEHVLREASLDHEVNNGLGALLGELLVVRRDALVVGVPFDAQVLDVRVLLEHFDDGVHDAFAEVALLDDRRAGLELDLVEDSDLVADDERLRAAVALRILVGLARFVRAGVGVVRDAVLVPIGIGATVGLRVVGLDAWLVDAGVFLVEDAVAIGVGRAAVLLRVGAAGPADVQAGVAL